jgi:hypothetical protein
VSDASFVSIDGNALKPWDPNGPPIHGRGTATLPKHPKLPKPVNRMLASLGFLKIYALDMAYLPHQEAGESARTYRRRMYLVPQDLLRDSPRRKEFRVERNWREVNWQRLWLNLWETPVDKQVKDIWFHVLHDIVPTKVRRKAIGMSEDEVCSECHRPNTIHHRLVECGDGATQWDWLRIRISVFLRRDPADIRAQWLYWPQFRLWPPMRHRATLWCLAQMVAYRCAHGSGQDPCDFVYFLQRAKWKLYAQPRRRELVANYLRVLEE